MRILVTILLVLGLSTGCGGTLHHRTGPAATVGTILGVGGTVLMFYGLYLAASASGAESDPPAPYPQPTQW